MPHSPNKENVASYASRMNKTPPPPSLVPMGGVEDKKKSLTGTRSRNKRVRFSLVDNTESSVGPSFSPVRLNADIAPKGTEFLAGRRSSVAASETSSPGKPLSFPSEEDLLRGDTNPMPAQESPPNSSPVSVASSRRSSASNALAFATSSFSNFFKPSRSLWDTPSRASPASTVSPRKSTTTPGGAERRLFQFKIGDEKDEVQRQFDFSSVMGSETTVDHASSVAVPIPSPRPGDDPMLLSGGTSIVPMSASSFGTDLVTPGSTGQRSHRRRRRRLSNLQDMESELYESGASPIRQALNIGQMSPKLKPQESLINPENFKEFFDMCVAELVKVGIDFVAVNGTNLDQVATDILSSVKTTPGEDNLASSQLDSICLSVENGVGKILDRIEDDREEGKALIESAKKVNPNSVFLFQKYLNEFGGDWGKFCAKELHELVKIARAKSQAEFVSIALTIAENQRENIVNQTDKYLKRMEQALADEMEETSRIASDCENVSSVLDDLKTQAEKEFNQKFRVNSAGEVERIKSDAEIELLDLDTIYQEKEAEVRSVVEEIISIEEECERRESVYRANFLRLNQFFSRNGWNVMKETSMYVFVYCCNHMLVFQRAKNNVSCLRFEDVLLVKLDPKPVYAESHLADVADFQVSSRAIYDVVPIVPQETSFLYEPQTFYNLMNVVSMEIAKWTKLRERLFGVRRKLNSLPGTIRCLVKVNVNYQVEILLAVKNSTYDGLPVTVRMMWFDPVIGNDTVNYSNFSYIISELVCEYFPSLKELIDGKIRESCTVWESASFELLESLVLGIHHAALKSPQTSATLPRE